MYQCLHPHAHKHIQIYTFISIVAIKSDRIFTFALTFLYPCTLLRCKVSFTQHLPGIGVYLSNL